MPIPFGIGAVASAFLVAAATAGVPAAEARRLVEAGVAQEKAGDLAAAADSYRAALRAAPRFAEAHDRLGFVLGQQGRSEDAIAEFRRATEADPKPFSFVNGASRAGLTTPTVFGGREENRYLLETILSGVFARA